MWRLGWVVLGLVAAKVFQSNVVQEKIKEKEEVLMGGSGQKASKDDVET